MWSSLGFSWMWVGKNKQKGWDSAPQTCIIRYLYVAWRENFLSTNSGFGISFVWELSCFSIHHIVSSGPPMSPQFPFAYHVPLGCSWTCSTWRTSGDYSNHCAIQNIILGCCAALQTIDVRVGGKSCAVSIEGE